MMTDMTIEKSHEIRKAYAKADDDFRAAKKDRTVKYDIVKSLKAKRDALEQEFDAAIKFLHQNSAGRADKLETGVESPVTDWSALMAAPAFRAYCEATVRADEAERRAERND